MQLSYDRSPAIAMAGMRADAGVSHVFSLIAQELIYPGMGLVKTVGEDDLCRLPVVNEVVITDDAGTYTAGDYVVTINGITVTTAFDTSKNTTLTAVAAALQALACVSTAVYSSTDHTITITAADNETLEVEVDISGITGNMTISSTAENCTDTICGISILPANVMQTGGGQIIPNDKAVLTLSGDALNTSDTVTVTINGTSLSAITYATSEAVTLGLVAQQIQAVNGVVSATVAGRVITVLNNPGMPLKVNSVVVDDNALASVAPSFAIAHSSQNTLQLGKVYYSATDAVNALRRGQIYVQVEAAVTSDDSVYIRHKASGTLGRGGFRNDTDSGTATLWSAAKFKTSAAANGFAIVEINLP